MEENKSIGRSVSILIITVICMGVFILRLMDWQITRAEEFKQIANAGYTYRVETKAKRGEIVDANGVSLAVNESAYTIVLDKVYMPKGAENETILKLMDLLTQKGESWIDEFPIVLQPNETFEFMSDKDEEIAELKSILILNSYATAENCMEKLRTKYNLGGYSKEDQRKIGSIRYNMTKSGYDDSMTSPYTFAKDISNETVAIISERAYEGVEIGTSDVRKYMNPTLIPHIVGTIGKLSQKQYEKLKDTYKMDDIIGKSGIEAAMEEYLKGKDGTKVIETTKAGSLISSDDTNTTVPGNTVHLTIDSKLQEAANKTLEKNVKGARAVSPICRAGSVVVLDVRDFSVLAAATYPNYDLEKYYTDDSYKVKLMTDETNKPLLDRAFNGAFAPGSIYKPVVACAALEEGVINTSSSIYCIGKYFYNPSNTSEYIRCATGAHGTVNLVGAMKVSCNGFFANAGQKLGIENLDLYAKRFGLGTTTGVEVAESEGVLAGPEYSKAQGKIWYEGNTPQASIGQSDNMFTPIQLATYTATIANGGNRYKTHLVKKVTDYARQTIVKENDPSNPELIENVGVSAQNIKSVQEAMRAVVTSGTATNFANYPVSVAAKTGTAETSRGYDHTTFICYAPYDKPEIAISVVLEYGAMGTYSRGIAKDMLDAYFNQKGISES